MSTIQSRLSKVADALTSIEGLTVYHYYRFDKEIPYCVWEEVTERGIETDNHKGEQAIEGAVHYFTKTEFDPYCDSIQEALDAAPDVYWRYDSVSYEEEANVIHHSWIFVVQ